MKMRTCNTCTTVVVALERESDAAPNAPNGRKTFRSSVGVIGRERRVRDRSRACVGRRPRRSLRERRRSWRRLSRMVLPLARGRYVHRRRPRESLFQQPRLARDRGEDEVSCYLFKLLSIHAHHTRVRFPCARDPDKSATPDDEPPTTTLYVERKSSIFT